MRNDFIIQYSSYHNTLFPCTVPSKPEMRGVVMRIDKINGKLWDNYLITCNQMRDGMRIDKVSGRLWEWYIVTCNHCGAKIKKPVWWLKLLFIFKRKLYFTCNECHSTSCYINFFRLIHDTTDEQEKLMNKYPKWDKRIR